MEASFWHSCWERNSLGFHQNSIHPFLDAHLKKRLIASPQRVFVPLCGKSDDMIWLAEYSEVVGAELSDIACRDFFAEKGIEANVACDGSFKRYNYKNIELWQGDFFKLTTHQLEPFDWIYDRAALIAMPVDMQEQYAAHLASFIGKNTCLFLISLEFPPDELTGPPFAIFSSDVKRLFDKYNVDCIAESELVDKVFAQREFNVSYLKEKLYLISNK